MAKFLPRNDAIPIFFFFFDEFSNLIFDVLRLVQNDTGIVRIVQERRRARLHPGRQDERFFQNRRRALRVHVERTNGFNLIIKKFETIRLSLVHHENIDDIAAHRNVAGALHPVDAFVAARCERANALISIDDRARFPAQRIFFQLARRRDFLCRLDRRRQDDARLFRQKRRERLHPPAQNFRPHVRHGKIGVLHDRERKNRQLRRKETQIFLPENRRFSIRHQNHRRPRRQKRRRDASLRRPLRAVHQDRAGPFRLFHFPHKSGLFHRF